MIDKRLRDQERDAIIIAGKLNYVTAPCVLGLLSFAIWNRADFFTIVGSGTLVSIAALVTGGLVGFLFGIPKSSDREADAKKEERAAEQPAQPGEPRTRTSLRRNTNIEEISDWLTKIIVGLGIYELKNIPDHVIRLAAFLSPAFGGGPGSGAVAIVLAVAFACSGFLFGYLLTVLFIAQAIARSDRETSADANLEQDTKAAEMVASVAGGEGGEVPPGIRDQVLVLAARYERERAARAPGPERTTAMEEVTRPMRALALAAYPMLDTLMNSDSPGQRLAAVAFLQIKPNPDAIPWLAQRFATEAPFIKYQAALALRNGAKLLPTEHRDRLRSAVQEAKKMLTAQSATDTAEYRVLLEAERELALAA